MGRSQFDPARALEHWGRYRPNQIALVNDTEEISYGRLSADTARVAESLSSCPTEERVAVLSHSKAELARLILGVVRSGRAVVVLNPKLPLEALMTNLADSGASMLLHSSHEFARELQGRLDQIRAAYPTQASSEPPIWAVMFSSGSTGIPKGIERDRASIAVEAVGWCLELGLTRRTRFYVGRPLFYTGGLMLALSTFLVGGTVVVGDHDDSDPRATWSDYQRKCRAYPLDWAFFVPDQLRAFTRFTEAIDRSSLARAKAVLTMGAPISGDEKNAARLALGADVVESWGNSESLGTITEPEDLDRKPDSIGRPFLTDRLLIVGEDGSALDPGQIGRIAGGKEAGFSGYAGRPTETASAFKDDLIVSEDLGYVDEDGYFFVLGRVQDAVIIGDRTVLIPTIEADIRAIPGIAECAAMALPAAPGAVQLACLIVVDAVDGQGIDELVSARLQQEAPAAVRVVRTAAIPRTASGKIDRIAATGLLRHD